MKIIYIDRKLAQSIYSTISNSDGDDEYTVVMAIFQIVAKELKQHSFTYARLSKINTGNKVPIPREAVEYAISNFTGLTHKDIVELKSSLED